MDWTQFAIFLLSMGAFWISTIGMWLWQRGEANADRRDLRVAIDESKRETMAILRSIQEEIKDFHGRLCAIEERNRK